MVFPIDTPGSFAAEDLCNTDSVNYALSLNIDLELRSYYPGPGFSINYGYRRKLVDLFEAPMVTCLYLLI